MYVLSLYFFLNLLFKHFSSTKARLSHTAPGGGGGRLWEGSSQGQPGLPGWQPGSPGIISPDHQQPRCIGKRAWDSETLNDLSQITQLARQARAFPSDPLLIPDAEACSLRAEAGKSIISFRKRQEDDIVRVKAVALSALEEML